jgi:hypothetical protein
VAAREASCQRLAASDEDLFVSAHCPSAWYVEQMADFDAGLLAYSQSAVGCEVTFQQQRGCNFSPGTNSQCPPLAWGLAQRGGSCGSQYACQPGLYCQFTGGSPCGTCQPASAIGGPCGSASGGATCLEGACNGEACATVVGVGGDCEFGASVCEPNLSCQGVCYAPGPVGTGCATDQDCQDGLACPTTAGATCATRPTLGSPCAEISCQLGLGCAWMLDGGTSCQTLTSAGSCVDDLDGGLCLEMHHCVDGGCVPLGVPGDPCGQTPDCAIGQCSSGHCTLQAPGVPCGRDEECASQRCDFTAVSPSCLASCPQ